MKQKVKAILASAFGCVLAALCVVSLSACNNLPGTPKAADPKEEAKAAVMEKLQKFTSMSASEWNTIFNSIDNENLKQLQDMGVDVGSFAHTLMSYMSFDITDVSVDDKTATVTVHMEQLDYSKMSESIGRKLASDPEVMNSFLSGDQSVLFKKVFEGFETEAKENPVYTEADAKFTVNNKDGKWVADSSQFDSFFGDAFSSISLSH